MDVADHLELQTILSATSGAEFVGLEASSTLWIPSQDFMTSGRPGTTSREARGTVYSWTG